MVKTINDKNASLTPTYVIPKLPLTQEVETKAIFKQLTKAISALAELKGIVHSLPNEDILVHTLPLQEAKDSSEIENIFTTNDELFRSAVSSNTNLAAKEVQRYAQALKSGYEALNNKQNLLTNNLIEDVQKIVTGNTAGFRQQSGTALRNNDGDIIYVPPQNPAEIYPLMGNLEQFINYNDLCDWHPLVKMAVIHHQFESIHPFTDGNGRTGRIINILYLVQQRQLDTPILYLSRYINRHKADYYRLLQSVRDDGEWEEWLMFMLTAIEKTSQHTTQLIKEIKRLMLSHKKTMREKAPNSYSQDLINNLFRYPYTKIGFVANELQVSRLTATKYLDKLHEIGILEKIKIGRDSYYVNRQLFDLFQEVGKTDI